MDDLVRVTRGLWRQSDTVADLHGLCSALLQALPPWSVIGGSAAGHLERLWLPDRPIERVEVLLCNDERAPRERSGSLRGEVVGRRRTVRADEVTYLDGLPVTTPARTWVDLAEGLSIEDLVAAGDSVLKGVSCAELDEVLCRAFRRRGVRKARAARAYLSDRSRSRAESHLRYGLIARGLPEPEVNAAIHDEHGGWIAEPDLVYRRARLALEYNGELHADPARMRRDITRQLDVTRSGWLTLVFGPVEVFTRMDQTAQLVRRQLDLRDPGWWKRRVAS